jgi:hypothetical protein
MEYAIGSVVTILTMLVFSRIYSSRSEPYKALKVMHTQSRIFELVKPAIPFIMSKPIEPMISQASLYEKKTHIRVIVSDGKAYWIYDNRLYQSDFIDGEFDKESGKLVDTMTLSKVELDKMSFIVDRLNNEGGNFDYRNTGNEGF